MSNSKVLTSINDLGIAAVTIDNPAKNNAFDDSIINDLSDAFNKISNNDSVLALVLKSNGKHFSAGADLQWMRRTAAYSPEQNLNDAAALANMLKLLNSMPKPTIARVQGAVFGGALGLVSCCDLAVASTKARFCLSEVKVGLIPATIAPYVLAAIGQRACRRYFTTAEVFDADTALHLGLIHQCLPEAELDQAVAKLIDQLLNNSPNAVKLAKQIILDMAGRPIDDALIQDSCQRIADIRSSAQGQEGLSAFLEKRPPSWVNE